LINAADDSSIPAETKWSFDKDILMIYNNKYQVFNTTKYFGVFVGSYKSFMNQKVIII